MTTRTMKLRDQKFGGPLKTLVASGDPLRVTSKGISKCTSHTMSSQKCHNYAFSGP
jgi:hypothetical protein